MSTNDLDDRIEHAKRGLDAKLHELQSRLDRTKELLQNDELLGNKWLRFGAAVAAGYLAGRFFRFVPVGTIAKRLVGIAATALVREAIMQWQRAQHEPATSYDEAFSGA
ncbi:MAG TPA: hypothetical protein VL463_26075 [Kofleriaceae bacterium]|jgi:hypothetical protein|nr:hypothetical protein [Kofleriaceae bacterium]